MKNKNIQQILSNLKSREEWIKFIQRLILSEEKPFQFNNYTILEFLIAIDDHLIDHINEKQLFHDSLMDFYISLRPIKRNSEYFSLLHFLFSKIRPISAPFEYIERQLLSKDLINLYDNKTNLHASLLASIRTYVSVRNQTIESFIFNSFESGIDPSVFDSNLVFLYRRSTSIKFFEYINKILEYKFDRNQDKLVEIISNNIEQFFVENSETYFKIFEWYHKFLKKNKFTKNGLISELDKKLIVWINYSNDGIPKDEYKLLLLILINFDIILPFEHFRILSQIQSNANEDINADVINHYLKNLYNKGIEYKIEIRGKESPIIKNKSIEHCYYDISPIDNKSDYWNYCCKRLACSNDLYDNITYGDYIFRLDIDARQEVNGDHISDINVVTMPLQSLGT